MNEVEWRALPGAGLQHGEDRQSSGESPGGMATTIFLEDRTKMAENPAQDECFKCQFAKKKKKKKNGGFAVFLPAKPSVPLWNSNGNWGELGPF